MSRQIIGQVKSPTRILRQIIRTTGTGLGTGGGSATDPHCKEQRRS